MTVSPRWRPGRGGLYVVGDSLDRDSRRLTFLDSFPAGTNLRFRERSEYDCSTCRGLRAWPQVIETVDPLPITSAASFAKAPRRRRSAER
ncbi:hypothetical protein Acy02nite_91690 [Actinoplanes cyaneus]|uniref:Uncharacterized protein n=1 Tax=Actinoplanes cyaneus TaxID=52696 RepID=A0A919MB74_9ACTN|nr:hypothetical protein Acy02nite_91690 [Actinoplanes cyaneus]